MRGDQIVAVGSLGRYHTWSTATCSTATTTPLLCDIIRQPHPPYSIFQAPTQPNIRGILPCLARTSPPTNQNRKKNNILYNCVYIIRVSSPTTQKEKTKRKLHNAKTDVHSTHYLNPPAPLVLLDIYTTCTYVFITPIPHRLYLSFLHVRRSINQNGLSLDNLNQT